MPKKGISSKNREWERERRERLNKCFKALAALLPTHIPTASLSKADIIQKSADYIQELKKENASLLEGNADKKYLEQVSSLQQRVKELVEYVQLLAGLLKTAGITVPPGPGPDLEILLKRPLKWSGKLSRDQAVQHLIEANNKKRIKKNGEVTTDKKIRNKALKKSQTTPRPSENSGIDSSPPTIPGTEKRNGKKLSKNRNKNKGLAVTTTATGSTTLGPGTLILANGTVMPVLPAGMLPLPLLMPHTNKLPIPALNRPLTAHKRQNSRSPLLKTSSGLCTNRKQVQPVSIKPITTRKLIAAKSQKNFLVIQETSGVAINEEAQNNINPETASKKCTSVEKEVCVSKAIGLSSDTLVTSGTTEVTNVSVEKPILVTEILVENTNHKLKNPETNSPASHCRLNSASGSTGVLNGNKYDQDNTVTKKKNGSLENNLKALSRTTPSSSSTDNSCEKSKEADSESNVGNNVNACVTDSSNFREVPVVTGTSSEVRMDSEENNSAANLGSIQPNITPVSRNSSDVASVIIVSQPNDLKGSVPEQSNCLGTSLNDEEGNCKVGKFVLAHASLSESVNKISEMDSWKLYVDVTNESHKRKIDCHDLPQQSDITNKKSRCPPKAVIIVDHGHNNSTDIAVPHQPTTSKSLVTTSDSVIKHSTSASVALSNHVAYSIDSLCNIKTSDDEKLVGRNTQQSETMISAKNTSSNSGQQINYQLACVAEELTSPKKDVFGSQDLSRTCASTIKGKHADKSDCMQNLWTEQTVEHFFNASSASKKAVENSTACEQQEQWKISDSNISNKSEYLELKVVKNLDFLTDLNQKSSYDQRRGDTVSKYSHMGPKTAKNTRIPSGVQTALPAQMEKQALSENDAQQTNLSTSLGLGNEIKTNNGSKREHYSISELSITPRTIQEEMSNSKSNNVVRTQIHTVNSNFKDDDPNVFQNMNSALNRKCASETVSSNNIVPKSYSFEHFTTKESYCVSNTLMLPEKIPEKSNNHGDKTKLDDISELCAAEASNDGSPISSKETSSVNEKRNVEVSQILLQTISSESEKTLVSSLSVTEEQKVATNVVCSLSDEVLKYQRCDEKHSTINPASVNLSLPETSNNFTTNVCSKSSDVEFALQGDQGDVSGTSVTKSFEPVNSGTRNISGDSLPTSGESKKVEQNIDEVIHTTCGTENIKSTLIQAVTDKADTVPSSEAQTVEQAVLSTKNAETGSSIMKLHTSRDSSLSNQSNQREGVMKNTLNIQEKDNGKSIPENNHNTEGTRGECQNLFGNCHCSGSEFSGDLFASLNVPTGHGSESVSPTAQFLLSFPLVSGGSRAVDSVTEDPAASQGSHAVMQIGGTDQSKNVSAQVCSIDGSPITDGKNPPSNNVDTINSFAHSDATFQKMTSVSLPSVTTSDQHLPLFKTPHGNHFPFSYEPYGAATKRSIENSSAKIPFGTADGFHPNFTLPEPCLAPLPFDKNFMTRNKSFSYKNIPKHSIHVHGSNNISDFSSNLFPAQQTDIFANAVDKSLPKVASASSQPKVMKVNNGNGTIFSTPATVSSIENNGSEGLNGLPHTSFSQICPKSCKSNVMITSIQNVSTNQYSSSGYCTTGFHQMPVFEENKSSGLSSFSMANNSSNFGILSWSTIPPVTAVGNTTNCETICSSQNSSDIFLPNISVSMPKNSNIVRTSANTDTVGTAILKQNQQQSEHVESAKVKHLESAFLNEPYPTTSDSKSTLLSECITNGSQNTLVQQNDKTSSNQQSTCAHLPPLNSCKPTSTSNLHVPYKKNCQTRNDVYKSVVPHIQNSGFKSTPDVSKHPGYKQASSSVSQANYKSSSASVSCTDFGNAASVQGKYKLPTSTHYDIYTVPSSTLVCEGYKNPHNVCNTQIHSSLHNDKYGQVLNTSQQEHFKPFPAVNTLDNFKPVPSSNEHNFKPGMLSIHQDSYGSFAITSQSNNFKLAESSYNNSYKSAPPPSKQSRYEPPYQHESCKKVSTHHEMYKSLPSSGQYAYKTLTDATENRTQNLYNQSRAPVNWMTTPDVRTNTALFPSATSAENNVPLPSSTLFHPASVFTANRSSVGTTVSSALLLPVSSQNCALTTVSTTLFPHVSTHSGGNVKNTFFPAVSTTDYGNSPSSVPPNLFASPAGRAGNFSQVPPALFPSSAVPPAPQSSVLFQPQSNTDVIQSSSSNLTPALMPQVSNHTGHSATGLVPFFSAVPGCDINQVSNSLSTSSVSNSASAQHPTNSHPSLLIPHSSHCGLSGVSHSAVSAIASSEQHSSFPTLASSQLVSRHSTNSFTNTPRVTESSFQSLTPSSQASDETSPSMMLMSGSAIVGDAQAPSSFLCPPQGSGGRSNFSSGCPTFFPSTLVPPVSSSASASGQDSSGSVPATGPSSLLGPRHQNLNLFAGPPQPSYGQTSTTVFPAPSEMPAPVTSRPCFLSVSRLVEGGNGKTRGSRRRPRRPPPPWHSTPVITGSYGTTPRVQHGRTAVRRVGPGSVPTDLVDLGGLLGSPLLSDDHGQRPPSPPASVSSLTNFNLSAIFPDIEKQQQQSSPSFQKTMDGGAELQSREYTHSQQPTFNNVLMPANQISRMQWS